MMIKTNNVSPFAKLSANKKIRHHPARRTTVWISKMWKSFGFPKCEIKNITFYSSERGVDAYNSVNEDEIFAMSSAIS